MPAVSRPLSGIAAASREVLARMVLAGPLLIDCVPAGDPLGLADRLVLHAGPPIAWAAVCPSLRGAIVGALRYRGAA
jgi:hypothetical protein